MIGKKDKVWTHREPVVGGNRWDAIVE